MPPYDTGEFGGGEGYSFEYLQDNYPWLLSILESHRHVCNPNGSPVRAFGLRIRDNVYCAKCKTVLANWERDQKGCHKVGVVGFGNFGQFMVNHLARAFQDVMVTDVVDKSKQALKSEVTWASLPEVANREIVILAVPFQNLEGLLKQVSAYLKPGALVLDVCSVKQEPVSLMARYVPEEVEILGTHPLFGPQSAEGSLEGHKIVLCPVRISPKRMTRIHALLYHGYLLNPVVRKPEKHDREMAVVRGLIHFIARAVKELGVTDSKLATKAFEHFVAMTQLLDSDSWELFKTIELGNPFAGEVRRRFVAELQKLERHTISRQAAELGIMD